MAGRQPVTPGGLDWRVALGCNGGACIQVAARGNQIVIGDSKNPSGPVLTYSRDEWHAFVGGILQGDFDGL
jgi:predicted secreted Zn-dependent protease